MPATHKSGTVRITHQLRYAQWQEQFGSQQQQQQQQPRIPVFITTSLTSPPWQMLEMIFDDAGLSSSKETEDSESVAVYVFDFHHVAAGRYQYKFRIGNGHSGGDGGGGEEEYWVLDEGAEVVEDDAGHRNSLLVVEEMDDEAVVSSETVTEGAYDVSNESIENDATNDQLIPNTLANEDENYGYSHEEENPVESITREMVMHGRSEVVDASSQPRDGRMSLFSHEHLDEAIPVGTSHIIQVPNIEDPEKDEFYNGNDTSRADILDPPEAIFSPAVDQFQASIMSPPILSPASAVIGRDNAHVSSPRPHLLPRVIRRTRSEILTRTTNIRPPLHQIIEESSVPDFRIPRHSDASSLPLIGPSRTSINEATGESAQGFTAEQGAQDSDEGIRQRKVSGGTNDSQGSQSINRDVDVRIGHGNGNILPVTNPTTHPMSDQQHQQTNTSEENSKPSIWQWLLRCFRRRSTLLFLALSALCITLIVIVATHHLIR